MVMPRRKEMPVAINDATPQSIGNMAKQIRIWFKFTQDDVAERLNVTRGTIINKEQGANGGFTGYELGVLARMFGQSPAVFYGGHFNPQATPGRPPQNFSCAVFETDQKCSDSAFDEHFCPHYGGTCEGIGDIQSDMDNFKN